MKLSAPTYSLLGFLVGWGLFIPLVYSQEKLDEIEEAKPLGSYFEIVEGEAILEDGAQSFPFLEFGHEFSIVVKPDFGEQIVTSRKFPFLPNDVQKIIKVSENEIPSLSRSITLEEDLNNPYGIRLTRFDFPSFYWGSEIPEVDELSDNEIENSEELEGISEPINSDLESKKSTWVKEANLWENHTSLLLGRLEALEIGQVYIEIEINNNDDYPVKSIALEKFVKEANGRGITVSVSLGIKGMMPETWQPHLSAQLNAIQNFNASVSESSKLNSVLVEIRPHLIDGFSLMDTNWQENFLNFIADINKAAENIDLVISIPYWFPGFNGGEFLAERLPEFVDGVLVRSFGKNRLKINRTLNPFLTWGERHNKPVKIGFDAGNLIPESRRQYMKSNRGRLLLAVLEGDYFLILLNKNFTIENRDLYNLSQLKTLPVGAFNFNNDFTGLSQLLSLLEKDLTYFLTFDGFAINSLPDF